MIVAIDGPAGSGKSSVSHIVADAIGALYLNSGRFYRAIAWKARSERLEPLGPGAAERLAELSERTELAIDGDSIAIDGHRLSSELHTPEIDAIVAQVSSVLRVRGVVNRALVSLARGRDVVAEGRDMATVVFPDAEIKIYLDASVESRARRRSTESGLPLDQVRKSIMQRDAIDREKADGALTVAPGARCLDTSDLTLDQVCETVIAIIRDNTSLGRGT